MYKLEIGTKVHKPFRPKQSKIGHMEIHLIDDMIMIGVFYSSQTFEIWHYTFENK